MILFSNFIRKTLFLSIGCISCGAALAVGVGSTTTVSSTPSDAGTAAALAAAANPNNTLTTEETVTTPVPKKPKRRYRHDTGDFYVRADVGRAWYGKQNATVNGSTIRLDIEPAKTQADLGVGLYVTPYLRSDITVQTFEKSVLSSPSCTGSSCIFITNGNLTDLVTAFINVYFEPVVLLKAFDAAQPYVGVGVGWAKDRVSQTTFSNGTGETAETTDENTQNVAAFKGIIGVAVELPHSFMIDLAYTYLYAGHAESVSTLEAPQTGSSLPPLSAPLSFTVQNQSATIGLRYIF